MLNLIINILLFYKYSLFQLFLIKSYNNNKLNKNNKDISNFPEALI